MYHRGLFVMLQNVCGFIADTGVFCWHVLHDGPEVQCVGIVSLNALDRFLRVMANVSFVCFVIAMKNDGRTACHLFFEECVNVSLSFVEEREVSVCL